MLPSPRLGRRRLLFATAAATLAAALPLEIAAAAPKDYETVGGYFFGQAAEKDATGFTISDADGQGFWASFRGLGGAEILGFPISRRFVWRGRSTQIFQRGVLQYDPLTKSVVALNVLDMLHDLGADPWLRQVRSVPLPLAPGFDTGKSWDEIVAARHSLLNAEPSLRDAYFAVPDPIGLYGLPTSQIEDMGSHLAIRTQRSVLQLWKQDTDWAAANTVTAALTGQVARDAGLFKTGLIGATLEQIFAPEAAPPPKPAPPPPPPAPKPVLPGVARPSTIAPGARWIDVNLSRQWVTAAEGDSPVRGAPCTSGKAGFATPTGTFQIFSRVYNETMDSSTMGIPRGSAEGYFLKDIFFTQYFAGGGYALHTNYWQPASVFGSYPTSHGCVGLRYGDAQFLWSFAGFGTPVYIHY
jgi:lipoprotein-anchoring transpeptidase ErfK/SrfK